MNIDFNGQKAIITGATRGIGRAVTTALLAQGATVIGVYGSNETAAEEFHSTCGDAAVRLQLHQLDVSDYQAVEAFYRRVEEAFDTIDILVNSAGIRRDGALAMMKEEDWRRVIDVNLTGGYNMSKFAVQLMMKQKYGRIVCITSPMGHPALPVRPTMQPPRQGRWG